MADDPIAAFEVRASTLRAFFDSIATLRSDAAFRVNEADASISCRFIDPADIAMGHLILTPTAFREAEDAVLGLDAKTLRDRLKAFDQKENVRVTIERTNGTMTPILILAQGNMTRKVATLDPVGFSEPADLAPEATASATLPLDDLEKALKTAQEVSDHVRFAAKRGRLMITAEADESSDVFTFDAKENDVQGEATSRYSLDYLRKIATAAKKVASTGTLRWATDLPLQIILREGNLSGRFLLASRQTVG